MLITSRAQLDTVLKARAATALNLMMSRVEEVLQKFLDQYYREYDPEKYQRTYQMYRSLVHSGVESTADGFQCAVYFDPSGADYTGWWNSSGKSAEEIWALPMSGKHGQCGPGGTAIMDEAVAVLQQDGRAMFKQALVDAGIPVV